MGRGWKTIALFILKNRIPILVSTLAFTIFFAFQFRFEIIYDFLQIIPDSDPEMQEFKAFKREFGEDGNTMVVGIEGDVYSLDVLNGIYELSDSIRGLKGVVSVASLSKAIYLQADIDSNKFRVLSLMPRMLNNQAEADSLRKLYCGLPFYRGLLVNDSGTATIIAANIDSLSLYSEAKTRIADQVEALALRFAARHKVKVHLSGLPLIRSFTLRILPREMVFFFAMAVILTILSLLFFFRSWIAIVVTMVVVIVTVIWTLGLIGLLHYKISILSTVLPSLITVIGIPNAIYLLTKYHLEYIRSRNKIQSLVSVIRKIGIVTVLTNMNTAAGFFVLAFTNIQIMKEFGIVAGTSVTVTFVVSLLLIPIFLSYLPPPNPKQTKHLDAKFINWLIAHLDRWVHEKRTAIYVCTGIITVGGIVGIFFIRPVSYLVDDIPKTNQIQTDLRFLEKNFRGVMPFEIVINTHQKQGITKVATLRKIDELQRELESFPDISRSLSILDMFKFGRQALLSGDSSEYRIPDKGEISTIADLARRAEFNKLTGTYTIFDSTYSLARVKANIGDVGSQRIKEVIHQLEGRLSELFLDSLESGELKPGMTYKVFGDEKFVITYKNKDYKGGEIFKSDGDSSFTVKSGSGKVDFADRYKITGTTKMFIKNNDYLISNLLQNMIAAIIVIALMMVPLFRSWRMMFISLIPNLIPLVVTTGIMGFAGIPLKPSTALIYSMSFGIAIDNTIHFLARYRYSRRSGESVSLSVTNSFKDTGLGMFYTSVILLAGFIIFAFSSHGGTVALGQLTSLTLVIALFANLLLLPALILSIVKDTENADEDFADFVDEEEQNDASPED